MWWQIFVCDVGGAPSLGCLADGCRTWGWKGDHKGRPYVPSFSLSEGEEFFSNHRRVDWGLSGRKLVGASFNSSSASDVARPSALRDGDLGFCRPSSLDCFSSWCCSLFRSA